ncbi:MAG: hypothetical protein ACP5RF_02810 [Candidatus Micrarchaeia archaeon]
MQPLFGYAITAAILISLILLIYSLIKGRKYIRSELDGIDKHAVLALVIILLFFLSFSILFVHPVEQLYFDENIYQGIAINILHHGNAFWCQYGTGYLTSCFDSALYHDPVEWSFFLAIAFGIFGIGTATAYNTQLAIGAFSIILFFLMAYVATKKRGMAVASTLAFSLMPELFIWSRTQADPDLPFMAFSILSFFLFLVFMRKRNNTTFAMFAFSLLLSIYMRTEGILLIGIFLLLFLISNFGIDKESIKDKLRIVKEEINSNPKFLLILLIFMILLFPQIYYIAVESLNPQYGQGSNGIFSISNFKNNFPANVNLLSGEYNFPAFYPAIFPPFTTAFAIIGIIFLLVRKRNHDNNLLALTTIWFLTYFLFYSSFYAGSALFGVDVRFMLQIMPPLSLLAGAGIVFASDFLGSAGISIIGKFKNRRSVKKLKKTRGKIALASVVILVSAFVIYPFISSIGIITIKPSQMAQQNIIYPAMQFFYSNYNKVPSNCLVFSFTPDIWYEVGRASAQIGYLDSTNSSFINFEKQYSCYVIDFGYWCLVPPYANTTCSFDLSEYKTIPLATGVIPNTNKVTGYYLILNYTP